MRVLRIVRILVGDLKMAGAKPNQKISFEKLEATLVKLEQLEEKEKEALTLRESIYFLRDKLTSALKKGYSYQDLSDLLEEQGILVSAATLKQYLTESKKETAKGKRGIKLGNKRSSPKVPETEKITSVEDEAQKQEKTVESSSEVASEGEQQVSQAGDTKKFIKEGIELHQEINQPGLEENQQSHRKPARSKSRKVTSSNPDLSSEFN